MHLVESGSTDPYFNIAAEEYLFRNFPGDLLMLYINSPSVIIGKHQNAYEEINYRYIHEKSIPVIRRISGGGSVYHDTGNLNFTFMVTTEPGKQVDFVRFIDPINQFLAEYGITPEVGEKREVRSEGLKFSGNAEHVFKNRVLHHGTILYSSELENLRNALKRGDAKFVGRSVQSNRTSVGNLTGQLKGIDNTSMLKKLLLEFMNRWFPDSGMKNLSGDEIASIEKLREEKYSKWDWNYAYSPAYELINTINLSGRLFDLFLSVKRGIIMKCRITDGINIDPLSDLLVGLPHRFSNISALLSEKKIELERDELYRFFG